ncbi:MULTISPECIES: STAS domain-containing protein [Streptomyces]|nr:MULTISPECIES: STAS domain-containing protein [Streptomyces]MYT03248.1 anti-sigma factor antagonist [Streptomyces sp. SID5470]
MRQAHLAVTEHTTADGVHVLALAGEIDHTTADTFRQALTADDKFPRHAVVDFRDVIFMDSSGINVLVAANNAAHAKGGSLRLAHTPARVLDLLHVVGLADIIPLYPTLNDALAAQNAA